MPPDCFSFAARSLNAGRPGSSPLASAVPIFGALGGATVNVIFMDHFQRVASGHFNIRRLERIYGVERIRHLYTLQVQALSANDALLAQRQQARAR